MLIKAHKQHLRHTREIPSGDLGICFYVLYPSFLPSFFLPSFPSLTFPSRPFNNTDISTTQKLLRFATILSLPIFITTQNAARLGPTCPELNLPPSPLPVPPPSANEKEGKGLNVIEHVDKTAFSMWIPEISRHFEGEGKEEKGEIVIMGIESHICVTQTALDALGAGHKVYVIADGVSSCNREEIPVALARLRGAGAVVTTSESFMYECMGDA
ncbi:Isochorismatase domain-containing protein 2, partial [Lachnellula arida]